MRDEPSKIATRRVALSFPARFPQWPLVVRGITDFARQHGCWLFTTSGEEFDVPVQTLKKWRGDGVITVVRDAREAAAARRLKVPVVTFVKLVRSPGVPRVTVD